MKSKNDETTAAGPTSRINPADFLAALERAGYRVSVEYSSIVTMFGGEPSGLIDAAITACEMSAALAVPASVRRFYEGAVKSIAAVEDREFVNTLKAEEGDDDNS